MINSLKVASDGYVVGRNSLSVVSNGLLGNVNVIRHFGGIPYFAKKHIERTVREEEEQRKAEILSYVDSVITPASSPIIEITRPNEIKRGISEVFVIPQSELVIPPRKLTKLSNIEPPTAEITYLAETEAVIALLM